MPPPPPRASSSASYPPIPINIMAAAGEPNRERGASSIPCNDFQSGKDDFESWIEKFQSAVNVATNAATDARKHALYLLWLPLKLDEEARAVLKQVPENTNYTNTITLMKDLLIDEVEVYKWRAMKSQITWDGKESFQALSTRVKSAVDKYEKELTEESKVWAYFFRFRAALPEVYQDFIDVSLAKDDKTIDNAKELALRVQMTQRDKSGEAKQVTFTGAAMADDRIHALELEMAKLNTQLSNNQSERTSYDQRGRPQNRDDYGSSPSRDQGGYQRNYGSRSGYRSPTPNRGRFERYPQRSDSYSRDRRDSGYDRSRTDRTRFQQRGNSPRYRSPSPRDDFRRYQSGRDNRDDNSYRPRNSRPFQRGRSPSPRGGDRSTYVRNAQRSPSQRREQFRAIQTADEDSDYSDLDDATLNACIESLTAAKANREARRSTKQEN